MKRIILSISTLSLLLILTACTPPHLYYCYDELSQRVVSVELIYYDNPHPNRVRLHWYLPNRHPNFDFNRVLHLQYLDPASFSGLFDDLSSFWIMTRLSPQQNAPSGVSIVLHWDDGSFDVISDNHIGRFHSDGRRIRIVGNQWSVQGVINRHFQ